jgi:ketosteroid isomerase-like protein
MPTQQTVETFVQLVEASQTVEAMVRFYAEQATMRENMTAPRTGKAALIKHEEDALATIKTLKARCVRPILISGDVVVIRWVFEIEDKKGKAVRFEELAYQRWQGELIVEEQFFYDPGQFAAP